MIFITPSVSVTVVPAVYIVPFITKLVTDNGVPSTSLSFANNPFAAFTVNSVSSFVAFVSATATGASFTAVTEIATVAKFETTPSLSFTV